MARKITLKDNLTDESLYPKTTADSVYNENGKDLLGITDRIYVLAAKMGYDVRYPADVEYTLGKYLSKEDHPVLTDHENAKVSSPISLAKDETIVFFADGSGICMIALTDSTASSYTMVVPAISGIVPHTYVYTATAACYVALSGVYTNGNYDFAILGISENAKLDTIEARLKELELSQSEIYDLEEQDAGDMLVTISSDITPLRLSPYTNSHTTIKVPLTKGKYYRFPFHDTTSYNFVVTDQVFVDTHIFLYTATIYGAKATDESDYVFGEDVDTSVAGYVGFLATAPNLYLYINLQFGTTFDYTDSFKLYESTVLTLDNGISDLVDRVTSLENVTDNYYGDKIIYVFGDSLTWLGGDDCDGTRSGHEHQGWTEYFKQAIKPGMMKSFARSGSTLSCLTTSEEDATSTYGSPNKDNILWNQIIRMKNHISGGGAVPDYVIIAAGINDGMLYENSSTYPELSEAIHGFLSDDPEDSLNTEISTTWYNNKTPSQCASIAKTLRWVKDACIALCPKAQIILLTPLQGAICSVDIQRQITNRIEECSRYLAAPLINQGNVCGISRLQESKSTYFTYDGTHTNAIGATKVGQILAARFKSYAF